MRARAEAAAETRTRVLNAVISAADAKPMASIVLADVAELAGVTVQTILRLFGTRDGLFDAAVQYASNQVAEQRTTPPGDVPAAVRTLFDHYESRGDGVIRLLSQEAWDDRVRAITDQGRALHRRWVTDAFSPLMLDRPRPEQEELLDLLVVCTDVYTWKLLRRDRGLSRAQAERRVLRMTESLLGR